MSKGLRFLIQHFHFIMLCTGAIASGLFAFLSGPQALYCLVSLYYWLRLITAFTVVMFLGYKVLLPQLMKWQRRTEENGGQAGR